MPSPLDTVETALITGASGGIGEAFARQLAARGKDLILVARSADKLEVLAGELASQHSVQTYVIPADLAQPSAAVTLFAETERRGLGVDLLVNNAGFAKGGEFSEISLEGQADMVRLNVNTLMELTRLYLPAMRQRRRGGIINVGSAASFQPVPYMAVYGATKAFVLSFSQALAEEVAADEVTVLALCPGATATGFQARAGVYEDQRDGMHTPDEVVHLALRAFERRELTLVPGLFNGVATFFSSRLLPRRMVLRLAARVIRGQMRSATPRQ